MSLRLRLTVWYAVVLSAALAVFGALIFFLLQERLIQDIDRELQGVTQRFESYFIAQSALEMRPVRLSAELREFAQAVPPSITIQVAGNNGFTFHYPEAARAPLVSARRISRTFVAEGASFRLETAASTADVLRTLEQVRILLLGLSPLVILIACAGGAWMSGRALKPVQEITARALNIGIDNLADRVPVPPTKDEIAHLSEVLNLMLARLESAVKTLSRFVADASHELRTPLAVIRATAEVALRRERSPESYRGSLEQIATESERMTTLVEDLMVLARSDTAGAEMPLIPTEVNDVVREACTEIRNIADLRQIRIEASYDRRAPLIPANQPALRRLFLVLLDNAVKYSDPGTAVQVRVSADGPVCVAIEDSGAGIDAASLPHIFKRFYRADPARSGPGHGLGLSLAESLARAHRATISVESNPGEGSSFKIVFQ